MYVFSILIIIYSALCFCCYRGDDLPKMGLLMVVLSLIFMSDRVITECKCNYSRKRGFVWLDDKFYRCEYPNILNLCVCVYMYYMYLRWAICFKVFLSNNVRNEMKP